MVRDAAFGSNFNTKLVISLITIGLVLYDRRTRKRWDTFWVFLTATVIWTLVELSLQLRGTRELPERILLGQELPLPVSAVIQGMSEAAFIAVLGLFVGDRILRRSTRTQAWIGFGLMCVFVAFLVLLQSAGNAGSAETVASRRAMLTGSSVLFLVIVVGFNVWFWWRRPQFRRRTAYMALVMLIFATVWTAASVLVGSRWVDVESTEMLGAFRPASQIVSLATLAYDVVLEITLAYLPFFGIPVLLGLINKPDPLDERDLSLGEGTPTPR